MMRVLARAAAAGLLALAAAGCGGPPGDEVVVFAAASLGDAFADIAADFSGEHPETSVTLNLAGSQRLAGQVLEGAPADVLATADADRMGAVAAEGLIDGEPRVFARNRLAIAVEAGNPHGVSGLADLGEEGLLVVLAAEDVPAGAYARQALAAADVEVEPVSLETDVRAVRSKVELGEADAGIVYASDIAAATGAVEGVAIPDEHNVAVELPIAALASGANPDAARAFVDFVRGSRGQDTLADHGFASP